MKNPIRFIQFKKEFEALRDAITQIEETDFRVLWIDDYYDGMLMGMLEYQGKKYRFEIISDYTDNLHPRFFAVIELTPEQIATESYWNNLFKEYVGTHNNYDSNEKPKMQPQAMHPLFYDRYQKRHEPNYDLNPVHAWLVQ